MFFTLLAKLREDINEIIKENIIIICQKEEYTNIKEY